MRHIILLNGVYSSPILFDETRMPLSSRTIGVYQLKHWLAKFGIKAQVIDFCQMMTVKDLMTLIDHFKGPETVAIGFSLTFSTYKRFPPQLRALIPVLREKHPNLKLICGGPNVLDVEGLFDKRFSGYAEDELVTWMQEELGKKGRSLFNQKFDITKLDHRFDATDCISMAEALPIELGRGCIFKCKFCSHTNLGKPKKTYQREMRFIEDEMRWNYEQFGTTKYNFVDDTVNEDIEKIHGLALLPEKLGFDMTWTGYLLADLVWAFKEAPELLMQSGLKSPFFGIETFNPVAGSSVGKGWAPKHGKDFLPKLHFDLWKDQIPIHLSFIVGLPTETTAESIESAKWVVDQKAFGFRFLPFHIYTDNAGNITSQFSKEAEQYGYEVQEDSWRSPVMTREDAVEAVKYIFNTYEKPFSKIASWPSFDLQALGFTFDEIRGMTRESSQILGTPRAFKFKTEYVRKLLALKE